MNNYSNINRGVSRRRRPVAWGIICAIVVVLFLVGGFAYLVYFVVRSKADSKNYDGATAVAVAFERALQDDRVDAAYALTTDHFQIALA